MHITKLFANLQEAGLRENVYATPKIDIRVWCRDHKMSCIQLAKQAGVSTKCTQKCLKRAPYFDEPEARRLLECLSTEDIQWRALLAFDLLSGLGRAELLGLRWCDVDLGTSGKHGTTRRARAAISVSQKHRTASVL